MFLLLVALLQPAQADPFQVGKGVALGGFALGVAGNLTTIGATLSLVPYTDPETAEVDPDALKRARPIDITGGSIRRVGGTLMGIGTLQMHGANRRAGAEYTRTFGQLSVAFGAASLVAYGSGQALTGSPDDIGTSRALVGSVLRLTSAAFVTTSFTMGFIQYVMNMTNKPAKRRKIETTRLQLQLVPSGNGLALAGRF